MLTTVKYSLIGIWFRNTNKFQNIDHFASAYLITVVLYFVSLPKIDSLYKIKFASLSRFYSFAIFIQSLCLRQ